MKTLLKTPSIALVGLVAAGLLSSCATKRYVRDSVSPVQDQVDSVEQKSAENATEIDKLDERTTGEVSRLDEKTDTALRDAEAAMNAAKGAQSAADDAAGLAGEAKSFAGAESSRLEKTMADMASYRKEADTGVLFGFDSDALTDEAKASLDSIAGRAAGNARAVFEVRGFTDATGAAEYNVELSRRRAEAVVRYLNGKHNVPIRAINRIGLGKIEGTENNKTREARKNNRRVDVSLYVPLA